MSQYGENRGYSQENWMRAKDVPLPDKFLCKACKAILATNRFSKKEQLVYQTAVLSGTRINPTVHQLIACEVCTGGSTVNIFCYGRCQVFLDITAFSKSQRQNAVHPQCMECINFNLTQHADLAVGTWGVIGGDAEEHQELEDVNEDAEHATVTGSATSVNSGDAKTSEASPMKLGSYSRVTASTVTASTVPAGSSSTSYGWNDRPLEITKSGFAKPARLVPTIPKRSVEDYMPKPGEFTKMDHYVDEDGDGDCL